MYNDIISEVEKPVGNGSGSIVFYCPKKECKRSESEFGSVLMYSVDMEYWYCPECNSAYKNGTFVEFAIFASRSVNRDKGCFSIPLPEFFEKHFDLSKGVSLSKWFTINEYFGWYHTMERYTKQKFPKQFPNLYRSAIDRRLTGHMEEIELLESRISKIKFL